MESLINHKYLRLYCEFLGILFIVFTLLFIIARFIIYLWLKYKARQFKWRGGPHTWAVITGCTEGIGLAYAEQLAAKGYNLLLISRNDEKLQKVKSDIEVKNKSARKVRTLAIDFFDTSDETYDKIDHMLDTLDEIHVLVNNVGTNYPNEKPEYMTKIPGLTHVIMSLINVNIVSCTRLTALVLPRMERRGRGVIINLSSFSALYPFELMFSHSLRCDWSECIKYAELIRLSSRHLPAFTTYCEAVFRYVKGSETDDPSEVETAVQLLAVVPSVRVRYFGKSVSLEKSAVMRAQKFSNTNECSVLPDMVRSVI
ncbi:unnamed protein product [Medioppia subpectinata]|uniref:Uncharacterized protein n=1 Tax=Medioppia subpectinata TaxID=1979941 RepID=A0A7R9L405_9ACAR|nr:unnamed protein product [Medioppia subpectinata]CAG2114846.1 unnamed protein product [Medioppia subpectinata]